MDNNIMKKSSESCVEQVYQIRPEHLNGAGRLFGGRLMEWIDEVAGLVGIRHSQCNVITASVDNLKFIRGVFQNDLSYIFSGASTPIKCNAFFIVIIVA